MSFFMADIFLIYHSRKSPGVTNNVKVYFQMLQNIYPVNCNEYSIDTIS